MSRLPIQNRRWCPRWFRAHEGAEVRDLAAEVMAVAERLRCRTPQRRSTPGRRSRTTPRRRSTPEEEVCGGVDGGGRGGEGARTVHGRIGRIGQIGGGGESGQH